MEKLSIKKIEVKFCFPPFCLRPNQVLRPGQWPGSETTLVIREASLVQPFPVAAEANNKEENTKLLKGEVDYFNLFVQRNELYRQNNEQLEKIWELEAKVNQLQKANGSDGD